MAESVKNPEVLNNLLKHILLNMFDQAHGEFEERTGKKVQMTRLQSMKYNGATKLVGMGVKQLDRFGNPEQKFERFVKISNEHLPTLVNIVGEDAVVRRLQKLPKDVLNADIVRSLDEAGAHEIAELLGKAVPEWKLPEPVAAPVAAPLPSSQEPSPAVAITTPPAADDSLATLKTQLSLMKEFEAQVKESITALETAIAAEEKRSAPVARPPRP